MPSIFIFLLAFLVGALHGWSFDYTEWFSLNSVLQLLSATFLIRLLVLSQTIKRSVFIASLFGLGHFLAGLNWLYISIHEYGHIPSVLAALAVFLFALFLTLYYSLFGFLFQTLIVKRRTLTDINSFTIIFGTAALWTLSETLRAYLFTGFPWLSLAYAHTDSPLSGFAPLLGSTGVTWLAAACAGALALVVAPRQTPKIKRIIGTLTVLSIFLIGGILSTITWTHAHGERIAVRLVQSNVNINDKFNADSFVPMLLRQVELARKAPQEPLKGLDFILFSETILPVFNTQLPEEFWQGLIKISQEQNASIGLGIPVIEASNTPANETSPYFNSVIGITPSDHSLRLTQGQFRFRYDKQHLVPFGEFVPSGFAWFVTAMGIPLGNFSTGEAPQAPFNIKDQNIAMTICYEDIFGDEVRNHIQAGTTQEATILANVSNLAWFNNSAALGQHLQMARMRVLETQRPMIRAANTGMTVALNHRGDLLSSGTLLPTHQESVLDVSVQGYSGMTPYLQWGSWPVFILILATLLGLLVFPSLIRRLKG